LLSNNLEDILSTAETAFGHDLSIPEQDQVKLWILNINDEGDMINETFFVADELPKYHFSVKFLYQKMVRDM